MGLFALLAQRLDAGELGLFAIVAAFVAIGQAISPALVGKPLANLLDTERRLAAAPRAFSLSVMVALILCLVLATIGMVVAAQPSQSSSDSGLALIACGAGLAGLMLIDSAFWVRVFTQHARVASIWRAVLNLVHLALVATATTVVSKDWLIVVTFTLLLVCGAVGCFGLGMPQARSGASWLTQEWRRWLPYLTGNASGLLLTLAVPLLLTLVAGLSAASTFRGAEILFGGANLVSSVLVFTTLASTRAVGRRTLFRSVLLGMSVVAANALALWLVPRSLLALLVGPVAPIVYEYLLILTVQRLAFLVNCLTGAALIAMVRPKVSGVLQTGGAILGAGALVVGGLTFGLGGALAGIAAADCLQAGVFMAVFLRRSAQT